MKELAITTSMIAFLILSGCSSRQNPVSPGSDQQATHMSVADTTTWSETYTRPTDTTVTWYDLLSDQTNSTIITWSEEWPGTKTTTWEATVEKWYGTTTWYDQTFSPNTTTTWIHYKPATALTSSNTAQFPVSFECNDFKVSDIEYNSQKAFITFKLNEYFGNPATREITITRTRGMFLTDNEHIPLPYFSEYYSCISTDEDSYIGLFCIGNIVTQVVLKLPGEFPYVSRFLTNETTHPDTGETITTKIANGSIIE